MRNYTFIANEAAKLIALLLIGSMLYIALPDQPEIVTPVAVADVNS